MLERVISGGLGLIVIWLIVTVIASLLAAFLYPLYKKILRQSDALNQASTLWVYAILPPIAAVLVVLLLVYPELSSGLVPAHCHANSCDPHLPKIYFLSGVGIVLVLMSVATLVTILLLLRLSLTKANRLLRTLNTLSQHSPDINYRVIDSPEILAWCAGIWQPKIYLSRGLVAALTDQQLQVVVVHELIHIARRDNLKKWLLRYVTVFWPSWLRSMFLSDFSLQTERACEQSTASRLDNPALIAQVMRIITEKTHNTVVNVEAAFEEKKLAMDGMSIFSSTTDSSFSLWAWLLIVVFWALEIILLTGITHLGLEWAIG